LIEWHPFSVTSGPEEEDLEIHVRALGDWTKKLHSLAKRKQELTVLVDGPYGSLRLDYHRYSHLMLVAGGIGFTPILGLLKDIYFSKRAHFTHNKFIDVIWSIADESNAKWFEVELQQIAKKAISFGLPSLKLSIHVTRSQALPLPVKFTAACPHDFLVQAPKAPLLAGRPKMKEVFEAVADSLHTRACLVFVCGPEGMVRACCVVSCRR